MLLSINDLSVTLGANEIFSHADFFIKGNEKIALVGPNGSGKSTFLKVLTGSIQPDRDDKRQGDALSYSRKLDIGMLSQNSFEDLTKTFQQEIDILFASLEEYSIEYFEKEVCLNKMITAMGFDCYIRNKKLSEFSGGQLTRLALIKLLLEEPDLLLLDEPTNHLDLAGTEWLEEYLKSYPKAVIIVSHDRFFLDQVAEITVEISDKKLLRYTGGYSEYRKEKEENNRRQKKQYNRYLEEKQRLESLTERFKHKPTKASFAKAKQKQMERLTPSLPPSQTDVLDINALEQPDYPGPKWIYEAEDLKIGYEKELYSIDLRIRRGQKLALIGDNGTGKSTLLKTIAGIIPKLSGKQTLGNRVLMGYFDQRSGQISSEKTVIEHFHDLYPAMTEADTRKKLAMWLFKGKDVYKKIDSLSGGEKTRLVMAELLLGKPNFLVLDEPTNHMDIPAKENLEKILKTYTGTQLIVSHDRYFISELADAILIMNGQEINYYPFGYKHYLEQKRKRVKEGLLPGELSAEDAALLSKLQNVPKKSPIQSRELTTDEAYKDWVMSQADDILNEAFEIYEADMIKSASIASHIKAEEALTQKCLEWYDKYLEFH